MAVCLNCGKENDSCLCDSCRGVVNLEDLCNDIIEYKPGTGENLLWDQMASELTSEGNFRSVVFALAEDLSSPKKEYWQILSFSGTSANVQKHNRPWLYEICGRIDDIGGLTPFEMNRVKGILLGALFMDYQIGRAHV